MTAAAQPEILPPEPKFAGYRTLILGLAPVAGPTLVLLAIVIAVAIANPAALEATIALILNNLLEAFAPGGVTAGGAIIGRVLDKKTALERQQLGA